MLVTLLMMARSGPAQNSNRSPSSQATLPPQNAQNKPLTTLTGTVSDSFCPRYHYVLANATAAECTRYCIAHQGQYIMKAGDKVYTLHDRPGHILDSFAGKRVRVTGWLVDPSTIEIKSVAAPNGKE
jgi:hypothetical protein